MKGEELQLQSSSGKKQSLSTTTATNGNGILSKSRYKLWAIGAILILAIWSMLTGSVTLKWSSVSSVSLSDAFDSPIGDLDILEVEEREKLVRRLWNVYTHSKTIRLPRFWQEAFEAGYEYLTSDVTAVRNGAVSEIAKMSLLSLHLEPLLPHPDPKTIRERRKSKKENGEDKKALVEASKSTSD